MRIDSGVFAMIWFKYVPSVGKPVINQFSKISFCLPARVAIASLLAWLGGVDQFKAQG